MRIQLDDVTEQELDLIKSELRVYGAGHSGTIAALIQHYKITRDFEKVARETLDKIPAAVTTSFSECAQNFAFNLFNPRPANKEPIEEQWP